MLDLVHEGLLVVVVVDIGGRVVLVGVGVGRVQVSSIVLEPRHIKFYRKD